MDEVEQLGDHLGASEPGSDYDEREHLVALGRVGLAIGALEQVEHVVAKTRCVLKGLQRERVLLHARKVSVVRDCAERGSQAIVSALPSSPRRRIVVASVSMARTVARRKRVRGHDERTGR